MKTPGSRLWGLIAAAGAGQRMGGNLPKQHHELAGQRVLDWSLRAVLAVPALQGVMVVTAQSDAGGGQLDGTRDPRVHGCIGGATRVDSVSAGLRALRDLGATDQDRVLVHDAARPAVQTADIVRLVEAVDDNPDGGLLAVPVRDTLKRADDRGRVADTVSRASLWQAMTPQLFPLGRLIDALEFSQRQQTEVTDESQAMEQIGASPLLVQSPMTNIKYTWESDRRWLETILGCNAGEHR